MSLTDQQALIERFYTAFQSLDHATMASCYHPDVEFEDALFKLKGNEVAAMWHMLCTRAKDFDLEFKTVIENGRVTAHWEPRYLFSQTGKRVHNIIDAEFEFKDGKIIRHKDNFDFKRWSGQAFGIPGKLLGGTQFFRKKVKTKALLGLQQFMAKHTN